MRMPRSYCANLGIAGQDFALSSLLIMHAHKRITSVLHDSKLLRKHSCLSMFLPFCYMTSKVINLSSKLLTEQQKQLQWCHFSFGGGWKFFSKASLHHCATQKFGLNSNPSRCRIISVHFRPVGKPKRSEARPITHKLLHRSSCSCKQTAQSSRDYTAHLSEYGFPFLKVPKKAAACNTQ